MTSDLDLNIEGRKFIPYNTGNAPLPLPEYGRTIQNMVDHCVMIENREERTACAYGIIDTMKSLFPKALVDKKDDSKFWDHLNIMARYELDIDFPCEVAGPEHSSVKPRKIPYTDNKRVRSIYGTTIENLIDAILDMPNSEEKDNLVFEVVCQMKKCLLLHNPETADDLRVLSDLYKISKGLIDLTPEEYEIPTFNFVDDPTKRSKKNRSKLTL
ncbi:MAG: DUF4290 domain-containing protein [Clostridium sp.]|nr:DUF4290 domain-containing protein [Prevotella sp.]MCM1428792.1 DUF4290 domain-containing protein [Clostridium sp.]MCM1475167.1 DUF4290 domain-containing protein [Muribaculaceae bacterium]